MAVLITPGEMGRLWTQAEAEGKEKMAPLKTVAFLPMFWGISLLVDTNSTELLVASHRNHMWLVQADKGWNQAGR